MSQTFDSPDKDPRQFEENAPASGQEKTGSKKDKAPDPGQSKQQQLTKEELPDSTNESRGNTGSGQRQDSN